jgi:hypothetical protein
MVCTEAQAMGKQDTIGQVSLVAIQFHDPGIKAESKRIPVSKCWSAMYA